MLDETQIRERLANVPGPDGKGDVVSLGMVEGLSIRDGRVTFVLKVPADRAATLEPLRQAAEAAVRDLPGVAGVTAVLTAERAPGEAPPRVTPQKRAPNAKEAIPGVTHVIAVASGKGGVGKSTTSVNLAMGLAAEGQRVGLLDADIYGPSLPRMLGITDQPGTEAGRVTPVEGHGVKVMSMGFVVEEDSPMIWRGPMVMKALTQMLRDVDWAPLDVLVVDMPPGTGDAALTLVQTVPLSGAVIVSTPQDIALIDARKGMTMFRKVDVPLLGLIENMSYFLCPSCGTRSDIFGHGGARDEAAKLGIPFLGEVPLHMDIRQTSDEGRPIVVSDPESAHAEAYRALARGVLAGLATAR